MSDDGTLILSPFTGREKRKVWIKTREKYMLEETRQNLTETGRDHITKQKEQLEAFLGDKSAVLQNRSS